MFGGIGFLYATFMVCPVAGGWGFEERNTALTSTAGLLFDLTIGFVQQSRTFTDLAHRLWQNYSAHLAIEQLILKQWLREVHCKHWWALVCQVQDSECHPQTPLTRTMTKWSAVTSPILCFKKWYLWQICFGLLWLVSQPKRACCRWLTNPS
jgi:hypothetical protein